MNPTVARKCLGSREGTGSHRGPTRGACPACPLGQLRPRGLACCCPELLALLRSRPATPLVRAGSQESKAVAAAPLVLAHPLSSQASL